MFVLPIPLEVTAVELSGGNLTIVAIVGVVALLALVMAMFFRREVLAANDGTPSMQTIARGVQEGASAYLTRQFRTLSVFAVAAFFRRRCPGPRSLDLTMTSASYCVLCHLARSPCHHPRYPHYH